MVEALVFLLFPLFILPIVANFESPKINPKDLDYFYDNLNDAKFASSSRSSGDVNPLYHILGDKLKYEKSASLDDINQLYQLMNKGKIAASSKDGNVVLSQPINLDFVNLTIFHKYDDLRVGNKMPLYFTNQGPPSARLIKKIHPKLVSPYANNPKSCRKPKEASGEKRSCVESLEDMMNFVAGLMGESIKPVSTPAGKWQMYTVAGPATTIRHQVTGCHKQDYRPFAVYGCHYIPRSQVRVVPLVGEDGTKLEAVSICHMDTSKWNGHHLLFMLLKAKPGPPVCHFIATDDVMWVRK